ncbi:MAG: FkbM family methyltransferase [Verrucomicrobiota bacterium]
MPDSIRKPLGTIAGKFDEAVIQRIEGFIFDLGGRKFTVDECTFIIPKDQTSLAYRSTFLSDKYERDDLAVVRLGIKPADHVIELGACMGVVSCITNKLLTNKSRHVVVEANPFCIPILHQNRDLNRCEFLIENCAISRQREVTFHVNRSVIVASSLQGQTGLSVRVPARSLAELDARYGPFTALIVDIEGAELETFENARDMLRRVRLVIVELQDDVLGIEGVNRCREILAEAGLEFQYRQEWTEAWQRP